MNDAGRFPRRAAIQGVACVAGAFLGLGRAGEAHAQEKLNKADAHYQNHPNGQQRCGICLQFKPPGTCQIVAGPIQPTGWCQFFAARENAH